MTEKNWGRYEELRPAQIDAIKKASPIVYLPWGALEWHSYHAPIGLDGIKALGLCEALARRAGGLVLPPVYAGTDTIKPLKGFKHTIEHSESTVESLCFEFLTQLADEDFRLAIVVMGHYGGGQVEAIGRAVETFRGENSEMGVWAFADSEPVEGVYSANHAARGETSYQLLFSPDLVNLAALPDKRETTLDDDGIWGENPRKASADEGARMLEMFVEQTLPRVKALIGQFT